MTKKELWLKLFAENDTALAATLILVERFVNMQSLKKGEEYIREKAKELNEEVSPEYVEQVFGKDFELTNFARIKNMSEGQLADFFYGSPEEEFDICFYCKNFGGSAAPEPCKTPDGCCRIEDKNAAFKK